MLYSILKPCKQNSFNPDSKLLFPFACHVASGTCWRVSDEAGVGPQTVPDPERLSLRERRHQSPEPAAAIAPGGVRQETDLSARRDRHRPV